MIKIKNKNRPAGFTLIEVVLVSALIGMVALAAYQMLSTGIKVWERARSVSVEEDILVFFDKLSMDLRNSFNFSLMDFKGELESIEFTTIISVPLSKAGSADISFYTDQIGRVQYTYDSSRKAIVRRKAYYGQAVDRKFHKGALILAAPIKSLRFEYLNRGELLLSDQKLDSKMLPAVITVSVEYSATTGETRMLKRTINLPLFS